MNTQTPLLCGNDGKPLTGRQTRWCSVACKAAGFHKTHRSRRTEQQRQRRAGQPRPLTTLERRVVDLEVTVATLSTTEGR